MFAEQHRVVARRFRVEHAVTTVVCFKIAIAQNVRAVAVDVIEHRLDRAAVTVERRRRITEKTRRNVLHRVEAKAVALRLIQRVERGANGVGVHVLDDRCAVRAVERTPRTAFNRGLRHVHVKLILPRLPDEAGLRRGAAGGRAEIAIHRTRLRREINQAAERLILHIELIAVVLHAWPVLVKISRSLQMKIFGLKTRIKIGGCVRIIAWHGERAVIHDVVEIHADAKAMRHPHHFLQLRFRAPVRRRRARLINVAEIKRIVQIVADGIHAAALRGRR